jgi:hypothetical protein
MEKENRMSRERANQIPVGRLRSGESWFEASLGK